MATPHARISRHPLDQQIGVDGLFVDLLQPGRRGLVGQRRVLGQDRARDLRSGSTGLRGRAGHGDPRPCRRCRRPWRGSPPRIARGRRARATRTGTPASSQLRSTSSRHLGSADWGRWSTRRGRSPGGPSCPVRSRSRPRLSSVGENGECSDGEDEHAVRTGRRLAPDGRSDRADRAQKSDDRRYQRRGVLPRHEVAAVARAGTARRGRGTPRRPSGRRPGRSRGRTVRNRRAPHVGVAGDQRAARSGRPVEALS